MFISGHFRVLGIQRPHFQCNANREVATTSPLFCDEPHLLQVLFTRAVPGTTFTYCSKHHFVVIEKAEQQVRKTSHCGTKQHYRSHVVLILFLFVRATWVSVFRHIPFVVNRTFTTTLTERLQHLQQSWARLVEMTESERDKQNANWENLDIITCNQTCSNNIGHNFVTYWGPFHSIFSTIF